MKQTIKIQKDKRTYNVFKDNSHYNNNIYTHIISDLGDASLLYYGYYISSLFVMPESRHQGIGTEILSLAESLIKDDGWEYCELIADRKSLIPFYDKLGYVIIKDEYNNGILMRKYF